MVNLTALAQQFKKPIYSSYFVFKHQADGISLGWIHQDHLEIINVFKEFFTIHLKKREVSLTKVFHQQSLEERNHVVAIFCQYLNKKGLLPDWRDELYGVYLPSISLNPYQSASPLFVLERNAAPFFGIQTFGAHINGYSLKENQVISWIGKRAKTKRIAPLKYDQIAAGGITYKETPYNTAIREAKEEASIPEALAMTCQYHGVFQHLEELEEEKVIRQETLFCFDLKLPPTFIPQTNDGEMLHFEALAAEKILKLIGQHRFKTNSAWVMLHFLFRHKLYFPKKEERLLFHSFFETNSIKELK